jgi:DNA-binding transcriptional MerR regulator
MKKPQEPPIEPLLLGLEDVAQHLSLSIYTIRRYIALGLIKPTRIGRRVTVSMDELRRVIREGIKL